MSGELAVQVALFDKLRADSGVVALLADSVIPASPMEPAIYDHVPQVEASESDEAFPYIVIGESTSVPFDADDMNGQEHVIVLHIWSRAHGRTEAKQISDAIYAALHNATLEVAGQNFVYCFWEFSESVPDPDERLKHHVTRFRITTHQ